MCKPSKSMTLNSNSAGGLESRGLAGIWAKTEKHGSSSLAEGGASEFRKWLTQSVEGPDPGLGSEAPTWDVNLVKRGWCSQCFYEGEA